MSKTFRALSMNEQIALQEVNESLVDAMYTAIPFLEDAQEDKSYKPGAVAKAMQKIKSAITKQKAMADEHEDTDNSRG